MNDTPAGARPVDVSVRPCAWATRYSPRGLLHALRDTEAEANDDAAIVGGSAHVVALYDKSALDAAVAAERERCARVADELRRDLADNESLRELLSDLLTRTANALRGNPPPSTLWSWHDLPERAAAAIAAIDVMQRAAAINGAAAVDDDIDVENLIAECVPAGSICDPQQVADSIRRYFDAWPRAAEGVAAGRQALP